MRHIICIHNIQMSQSDYLKYKRIATELKTENIDLNQGLPGDLPPVLESSPYVSYKEFALVNNIKNTKTTYNQLLPSTQTQIVFNMEKQNVGNCPNPVVCTRYPNKSNRVPLQSVYAQPTPARPLIQVNKYSTNCVPYRINRQYPTQPMTKRYDYPTIFTNPKTIMVPCLQTTVLAPTISNKPIV